jgi:hypothetical protein
MPKDTVLSLVMRSFSILYAEALLLLSSFTLTIFINTFHYLDILLHSGACCSCCIFIPVLPASSQAVYVTRNSLARSSRDGRRVPPPGSVDVIQNSLDRETFSGPLVSR